jgi:hypothetical protein
MPDQIWPNFFIVGAMKSGTTSLWAHLKKHPQVFFPDLKEPNFFQSREPDPKTARKLNYEFCIGNEEKYLSLFSDARGYDAIGDASPTYLWDENAPTRIREVCPHARIIIILRDPISRAQSHYLMNLRDGMESYRTFEKAIEKDKSNTNIGYFGKHLYVEMGLYYEPVKRYVDTFGQDRVLVVLLDDLMKDPLGTMLRVTNHLGIKPLDAAGEELGEAINAFKMPRFAATYRFVTRVFPRKTREKIIPSFVHDWLASTPMLYNAHKPKLGADLRQKLQEVYEPNLVKLEGLLGRKMPELRKSWARNEK